MRGGSSSASEVAARRSIGKGDSDGRHYLVRALQVTGLHSLGGAGSLGGLAGGLAGNRRLGGTLCLSICGQNRKPRGPRCHEIEAAYSIGRPTARGGKVNSLVSTRLEHGSRVTSPHSSACSPAPPHQREAAWITTRPPHIDKRAKRPQPRPLDGGKGGALRAFLDEDTTPCLLAQ